VTHGGEVWHLVGEQRNRPGFYIVACNRTGEKRAGISGDTLRDVYGMRN